MVKNRPAMGIYSYWGGL